MKSWSRPGKSQAAPPPLYLTAGDSVPYCHTCGRVIGRKSHGSQEVKYCSTRCRNSKPRLIDRRIEAIFVGLLDGTKPDSLTEHDSSEVKKEVDYTKSRKHHKQKKTTKGDRRISIECGTVEEIVFPRERDLENLHTLHSVVQASEVRLSVDPPDSSSQAMTAEATKSVSQSDNSAADHTMTSEETSDLDEDAEKQNGKKVDHEGMDDMALKRREGQRRADKREMVRRAARRLCVFGVSEEADGSGNSENRKCEAIQNGMVVESSFAKGEWGIRWRQKVY